MEDVFGELPKEPTKQGESQPPEQQPPEPQEQPQQPPPEEPGTAAPPAADASKHVPLSVLEAARKDYKGQAAKLEGELAAIREERDRLRAAQSQQPQQPQDPLVQLQQQMLNDRLNTSEMMLRDKHADVDDVIPVFMEAARQNPALAAQMYANPHPWKFAYDEGKRMRFAAEVGNDPAAYRKRIEDEVRAELAKAQAPAQSPAAQAPSVPASLADARSSGARGATWTGPRPFDTLFPN